MTIQLPPLSSSRTGPPQKLVRQARERAHYPETATYDPRKEDTVRSVTSDQLVRRLPTVAYPQKSDSNLSQGPVIYRPHPHQKHTGLLEFRAPSHPLERGDDRDARPPPGPECTAARSARGRRPFKHETVRSTTLVEGNHVGSCRGFWGGRSGHKRVVSSTPGRSAQSARTRAGSTARGRETGVPSPPKSVRAPHRTKRCCPHPPQLHHLNRPEGQVFWIYEEDKGRLVPGVDPTAGSPSCRDESQTTTRVHQTVTTEMPVVRREHHR